MHPNEARTGRGRRAPNVGTLAALAVALLVGGCHREYQRSVDAWYAAATRPSHAQPTTPLEQETLERLPSLGPDAAVVQLTEATLTVEPMYASAARLVCRAFVLQAEPASGLPVRRVACRDGDTWFLTPDLLEDGSSDGPEDEP